MYRSLLVPIDGSTHSARALPVAAALARKTGATLELVLVHDPSAYIPFVPGEVAIPVYDQAIVDQHKAQDQHLLDRSVHELTEAGIPARGRLLEGTIVEALEEHVVSAGIDLVVMTTHGRRGFDRLRLGSIASSFLTRATVPVLLVRGALGEAVVGAAAALPTGRLLVALDGSPFSEAILPHAHTFAEATGMSLHLVGVSVPHAMPMAPFGAEALLADDSALQAEEAGRLSYLERIRAASPHGTTDEAVTDMSVSRALLDVATRPEIGAIAMATHGRGGFKRLVLGSVADEVIRHADRPLLVYRPTN